MAVGVIIGGAFSAIITAFIENIINPIIGLAFQTDFS
ncbi:MAG: MscL family protein, partial [Erysipelotrichaceae bacterium]|nr:MscL family protein [Erysipelotrichaceae bacterium]